MNHSLKSLVYNQWVIWSQLILVIISFMMVDISIYESLIVMTIMTSPHNIIHHHHSHAQSLGIIHHHQQPSLSITKHFQSSQPISRCTGATLYALDGHHRGLPLHSIQRQATCDGGWGVHCQQPPGDDVAAVGWEATAVSSGSWWLAD